MFRKASLHPGSSLISLFLAPPDDSDEDVELILDYGVKVNEVREISKLFKKSPRINDILQLAIVENRTLDGRSSWEVDREANKICSSAYSQKWNWK